MIKQYFIQSLNLIRQNRLLSTISMIGTALAIAMIMCIVLIYESKVANYEPEMNRDRTLMVGGITATEKEDSGWNNGGYMSLRVAKECFYSLTTAEAVTAVIPQRVNLASSPGEPEETKCVMSYTDDTFWKVFSFRFLSGKPYNQAEFAAELLDNRIPFTPGRFVLTSIVTYGMIMLMIVLGVSLPARQASKVQPAEALHEE